MDAYIREQIVRKVQRTKAEETERELVRFQRSLTWFKICCLSLGYSFMWQEYMIRELSFSMYDWKLAKKMIDEN